MRQLRNIVCWGFLAVLFAAILPVSAQSTGNGSPTSDELLYPRRTPIVVAFEKNKDAVVSITGKQLVRHSQPFWLFDDWPFPRPQLHTRPFLGSGFILDERGYIVTNAHVVEQALEITIIMADNTQYEAQKISQDSMADLALLKIESDEPLPTVKLGHSNDLMIGETVLAIGNPFGYQHTLTDGIISAEHSDMEIHGQIFPRLVQISAPINPGNSGGPLLNINGEVIAINTAIRQAAEAIGFAIPIDRLREVIPSLLGIERLRRIDFGLEVGDIPETAGSVPGLQVQRVRTDSAADQAGFQVGDVINKVNGRTVYTAIGFYLDMWESDIDSKLNFDIKRLHNDTDTTKSYKLRLILRARPKPDAAVLAHQLFGIKLESLTAQAASRYSGAAEAGNIMVVEVQRASPAQQAGIEAGDFLIGLGGILISDMEQLGLRLETLPGDKQVNLTLNRIRRTTRQIQIIQYERTLRTRSTTAVDGSIL